MQEQDRDFEEILSQKRLKGEAVLFEDLFPFAVSEKQKYNFTEEDYAVFMSLPEYKYHNYPKETEEFLGISFAPAYNFPNGMSSEDFEKLIDRTAYSSYVLEGTFIDICEKIADKWHVKGSLTKQEKKELILRMHAVVHLANQRDEVLSKLRGFYQDIIELNPELKAIPDPNDDIDLNIDFLRGVSSCFPIDDIKLFMYGPEEELKEARNCKISEARIEKMIKDNHLPPLGNSGAFSWILSKPTWERIEFLLNQKQNG